MVFCQSSSPTAAQYGLPWNLAGAPCPLYEETETKTVGTYGRGCRTWHRPRWEGNPHQHCQWVTALLPPPSPTSGPRKEKSYESQGNRADRYQVRRAELAGRVSQPGVEYSLGSEALSFCIAVMATGPASWMLRPGEKECIDWETLRYESHGRADPMYSSTWNDLTPGWLF